MVNNTTLVFNAIQKFIALREDARAVYLRRMKEIEEYVGSKGYDAEKRKAANDRAAAVEAARQECEGTLEPAFRDMYAKNNRRTVQPPTAEELRLLSAVQMMRNPSEATLDAVANSLTNVIALAALDDLAAHAAGKDHPVTSYAAKAANEISVDRGVEEIKALRYSCTAILQSPGGNRIREMTAKFHKERYGADYDPDTFDREKPYNNETDFIMRELNLDSHAAALFSKAVNGEV